MSQLANRVGLVTGGGTGIGRGISVCLAQAGVRVALLDTNGASAERVAQEIADAGGEALPIEADVRAYDRVELALQRTVAELGAVDLLVNNAGVGHPDRRFTELERSEWQRVIDVCLYGTLNATRAVLPSMMERGFGRIVNISSLAARVGGSRSSVYAAAKAAIIGHTRALAQEVGEFGVTVNVVCPGETETERTRQHLDEIERREGKEVALRRLERALSGIPLGRLARPEDIAAAVIFLCGEGSYVTGQTLVVDGGMTTC